MNQVAQAGRNILRKMSARTLVPGTASIQKLILFLALIVHSDFPAQDQLCRNDSSRIAVRIVEVGPDEIRYRLFSDPRGAIYVENKKNVARIIYENGRIDFFGPGRKSSTSPQEKKKNSHRFLTRGDSLIIYRHRNNLSANLVSLINNEVGVMYRHEFYESRFCIVIPMAIGFAEPHFTQRIFDERNSEIRLDRKLLEIGIGGNYYPTYRTALNYYIGPVFRYMRYDVRDLYMWRDAILSRYAFTITNGVVVRSKSGLTADLFISAGFSNDKLRARYNDPSHLPVSTIAQPIWFYLWSGVFVGFGF